MARRFIRAAVAAVLGAAMIMPTVAFAGSPVHTHTSFTFTLADAIAEYQAFGVNDGDCGDFVLLIDYHVERDVTRWGDHETRHVKYTGNFYSSADLTRSIPRNGNFELTMWFGADGSPLSVTRKGLFEYVVIDGRRIVTHAGHEEISFATGPISATPKAGADVSEAVCDALG
jgi:hypothetical protein